MDLPLSSRVLSNFPNPTAGGGVIQFSGSTAAELQRSAEAVLAKYGNPAQVPTAGGTPATMIRGMTLTASSSGTGYFGELQIEPDEAVITTQPQTYPIVQQCPVNATVGTFGDVGWSAVQCFELADPSELARRANWATTFWTEQINAKNRSASGIWLYEVALAGPFNRGYVAAMLWSFQQLAPLPQLVTVRDMEAFAESVTSRALAAVAPAAAKSRKADKE